MATKVLNQAVKRNVHRFPLDFMFQLSEDEAHSLRSQSVTSKTKRGGRRYLPYAFTEHGAVMLASVLNSPTAVKASIIVVRA
ncbi:MAG: ORF6N domain-containing protein, partial [Acidobacteriota bacterium]